jgi:hypothetical protein
MLDDTPLMSGEKLVTGEDGVPTKVVEKNFWQKYVGVSIYICNSFHADPCWMFPRPANCQRTTTLEPVFYSNCAMACLST